MQRGFFYDFSNYGSYERLTQDGLTEWHPAFLALGSTLELSAWRNRVFKPGFLNILKIVAKTRFLCVGKKDRGSKAGEATKIQN